MSDALWTQDFPVSSFLADHRKRLGLPALLNLLQDAAWMHATRLGHGYDSVLQDSLIWVLTRQKVAMESWPAWGERVTVRTWVRPSKGPIAARDFEVLSGERVVGAAATSWLLVDARTRRPARRSVADLSIQFRPDATAPFDAPKVEAREGLEPRLELEVRHGDLDLNQHVNNTRYAQWVLDALPRAWHPTLALHGYEVNFLAEACAGDRITIRTSALDAPSASPAWLDVQGWREADRKVVFAARLQVSAG